MCNPMVMFAAQAASALGSAVAGAGSDIDEYNAKIKALNQEASAIDQSTVFKYQLSNLQQQQIQDKGAAQVGDARMKLVDAEGTAGAAAASAGMEGNSVQQLLNSFATATGRDVMFTNQQTDNEILQVAKEKQGFQMDANARKRALVNQIPQDPSSKIVGRFLEAAFKTGSSYMSNTTKTQDGSGLGGRRFGQR